MRYKEFWIALGVGALSGGIAALLYAPQSGENTRKKLRRGLVDAGEALEEAGAYLKKQAEILGSEAQKLIESNKGKLDTAVDQATGYVASATKAAQKLV